MDLTPENKTHIDSMDIEQLLSRIRFAPIGDEWFQGETGKYWMNRYAELRDKDPESHFAASKRIGCNR